jgi:four helix bundle protein
MKTYRDLIVWQKAMSLVTFVYKATANFPQQEQYGLTSQMRRAAVSIPSNIAEGYGRFSKNEFCRFLEIAKGSLLELQTQMEIASNLDYVDDSALNTCFTSGDEVAKLITSLIKHSSSS